MFSVGHPAVCHSETPSFQQANPQSDVDTQVRQRATSVFACEVQRSYLPESEACAAERSDDRERGRGRGAEPADDERRRLGKLWEIIQYLREGGKEKGSVREEEEGGGGGRRRREEEEGGGGGGGRRRREEEEEGGGGRRRREEEEGGGGGRRRREEEEGGGGGRRRREEERRRRRGGGRRREEEGGGGRRREEEEEEGGGGGRESVRGREETKQVLFVWIPNGEQD